MVGDLGRTELAVSADEGAKDLFRSISLNGVGSPLQQGGATLSGAFPDRAPIAKTAVRLNGRNWTTLLAHRRDAGPSVPILLIHETWRRIQDQIGLPAVNADQDQLAVKEGDCRSGWNYAPSRSP